MGARLGYHTIVLAYRNEVGIHARDNFFARTCFAYLAIDPVPACPLAGFETPAVRLDTNPRLIDNREPPFGSRQLVINFEPAPDAPAVNDRFHSSSGRDGWIPKAADGVTPARRSRRSAHRRCRCSPTRTSPSAGTSARRRRCAPSARAAAFARSALWRW